MTSDILAWFRKHRAWHEQYGPLRARAILGSQLRDAFDIGPGLADALAKAVKNGDTETWDNFHDDRNGDDEDIEDRARQAALSTLVGKDLDDADLGPYQDAYDAAPEQTRAAILAAMEDVDDDTSLLYALLGTGTEPYKMPQDVADYADESPHDDQACGNCEYFYTGADGTSICSQIRGEVVESGWCRLWEAVGDDIAKERVYVDDPSEAPEGAEVQQGERGGLYYEGGAAQTQVEEEHIMAPSWSEVDMPEDFDLTTAVKSQSLDEFGIEGGVNNETMRVVTLENDNTAFVKREADYESDFESIEGTMVAHELYQRLEVPSPTHLHNEESGELAVEGVKNGATVESGAFEDVDHDTLVDVLAIGLIAGNPDMHPGNIIVQPDGTPMSIDNDRAGNRIDGMHGHEALTMAANTAYDAGMTSFPQNDIEKAVKALANDLDPSEIDAYLYEKGYPAMGSQIASNIRDIQERGFPP